MIDRLTRLNVVVQMENLRTHPSVQRAMANGVLQIHGWVYDIAAGAVQAYNPVVGEFQNFPWTKDTPPGL